MRILVFCLAACRLTVDIGDTNGPRLTAVTTGIRFNAGNAVRMRNTPDGALLVCNDRECELLEQSGEHRVVRLGLREPIEDFVVPLGGDVLVASAQGLALCPFDGSACAQQTDLLPPRTAVLGLVQRNAQVLFVTSNALGAWSVTERRIVEFNPLATDAPIVGTCRAGDFLRLSRSPFLCRVTGPECVSVETPAAISQVVAAGPGRWVFASEGVLLYDGETLDSVDTMPMRDAIAWQGGVWLATDRGLLRYDVPSGTVQPLAEATSGLERSRISGLGLTSDGSLAVYSDGLYLLNALRGP